MNEVFWRLHEGLPKQGPGSDASTGRALALVDGLPRHPRILDLGCGPGRQSLVLARRSGGHVTAVDVEPRLLAELEQRVARAGLAERIEALRCSMLALDPERHRCDLIWSEGAIYSVGFEAGLRAWRELLRPGGSVAVSELAWLARSPPERLRAFWETGYPAMKHHEDNLQILARCGYELTGSFVLPDTDWTEGYYDELALRIARLRGELTEPDAVAVLDAEQEEIDVFHSHAGAFGYVFYVARRRG